MVVLESLGALNEQLDLLLGGEVPLGGEIDDLFDLLNHDFLELSVLVGKLDKV